MFGRLPTERVTRRRRSHCRHCRIRLLDGKPKPFRRQ